MFGRVSTIEGSLGRLERGIRFYREQVVTTYRELAGFKGAYLFVNRKTGNVLSITLWETEQTLEATSAFSDRHRVEATDAFGAVALPRVELYEVVVQP